MTAADFAGWSDAELVARFIALATRRGEDHERLGPPRDRMDPDAPVDVEGQLQAWFLAEIFEMGTMGMPPSAPGMAELRAQITEIRAMSYALPGGELARETDLVVSALASRPPGLDPLLSALGHGNAWVRYFAATSCYRVAPDLAMETLKGIAGTVPSQRLRKEAGLFWKALATRPGK